tara:strand:+ start:6379 stop:6552 length:174 start_codon:yes stop_codon:yes gene_type:complete
MEKSDVLSMAQLLTGIKDALDGLEKAQNKKDLEGMANAKREILSFQHQVERILKREG